MIFLERLSRKQDHHWLLENILRADGFDGEVESSERLSCVQIQV